ncbi:probable calcium-binding protein CML46 [Gastrolobium bilobum]|uniref:probable calcium-binding protein CML46 n=1 Tax=Gastrolobium bilobum TaxID=150636 RepID=UPI002AB0B9C6|nr:probable calcium-binding protein CML46 [Gastrolobium bilobum]
MEKISGNINISGLSLCLRILLCDIRIKGFLSILFFSLQCLWNCVSQIWKVWSRPKSYSNPEPVKQSLKCIQSGVRLCKEEIIVVMEKLGINVEKGGDGIEEFGEQEIAQMLENEASLEEVKEAFDVFDENKDGFVDATELQRVLCCLGLEKDFVQCQKMINAVDQNGDELIDLNEFVKLMEQSFW